MIKIIIRGFDSIIAQKLQKSIKIEFQKLKLSGQINDSFTVSINPGPILKPPKIDIITQNPDESKRLLEIMVRVIEKVAVEESPTKLLKLDGMKFELGAVKRLPFCSN